MANKIRNYFNVVIWPIMFMIGQFLLMLVIGIFYLLIFPNGNYTNFINHHSYLIVLFNIVIFLPIFLKEYQKYSNNYKNKLKDIPKIIVLGIVLSFLLNLIIYFIKIKINQLDQFQFNFFNLLNIALIGPILEEYLFRGIVFNKLLKFNSERKAYYIAVLIFALMHMGGLINMFYAFIMGLILNKIYIKYKNIKANIIFHIAINTTSNLLFPLIVMLFI